MFGDWVGGITLPLRVYQYIIQLVFLSIQLLESSQWNASQRVSIFLSMKDEINTEDILRSALRSQKECFIPRYVGSSTDMLRLNSWQDYESLPVTSWNIKQPADDDSSRKSALECGTVLF